MRIQRAKPKVAVIGAGVSGLTVAQALEDVAHVQVLEKARGVGGRMATRRAEPYAFDHGAQFFTARSRAFKRFIMPYIHSGFIDEWQPKLVTLQRGKKPYKRSWFEPHWVGIPGMNALCKELAQSLNVQVETHITGLHQQESGWLLTTQAGDKLGPFDWVVLSAPAPQTLDLLPNEFADYSKLQQVEMGGCFTLMLGLNAPPTLNFQVALIKDSPIEWVAVNSHKPGRSDGFALVAHSDAEWTREQMESSDEAVQRALTDELLSLLDIDPATIEHTDLQRWRYSRVLQAVEHKKHPYSVDSNLQLAVCGDCFGLGRVESAFTSGQRLGKSLHRSLKRSFMAKLLRR